MHDIMRTVFSLCIDVAQAFLGIPYDVPLQSVLFLQLHLLQSRSRFFRGGERWCMTTVTVGGTAEQCAVIFCGR